MRGTIIIALIISASAALFIVCDALSAHWGKTASGNSLMLVFALSPLSYFLFALANKHVDLAIAGSLINTIVVAGAVLVGVFVFGEQLSKLQVAGIGMALVSVTLLNLA